jgi:catechol 2,3-dioxygenase-like lactoylglutathione lyase family enzyme
MSLPAYISLVTLGVADVARAKAFYAALGWPVAADDGDDFCVFDTGGPVLALYPADSLAEDAGRETSSGVRSALAINVGSVEEVDAGLAAAEAAGGRITRAAQQMFWGGYSGYFADPDGHAWEVAYNPHWSLDRNGRPTVS